MDHTVIYLAPPCFGDERHWCEDDAPVDCECDDGPHPWIKFTADSVVQELRAENVHSREEGARIMQERAALAVTCGDCGTRAFEQIIADSIRDLDPAQVVKGEE